MEEVERLVLQAALDALTGAALVLGLNVRTLYNKRQKYHLGK